MASILTFVSLQCIALAAHAFTLTPGSPVRLNTKRTAPPVGLFDLKAPNAGINRADCLDTAQKWQFSLDDVPAEATKIEIWARADDKSCAPPSERTGYSPSCVRVASVAADRLVELDNLAIIQAADKRKNVDSGAALDAKQVCAKAEHMKPTGIHLHVLAFEGTDVIGYSTNAPAEIDYQTLYDLMGPNPPTELTLGVGEGMLAAKFTGQTATDFARHRAYCFRGTAAGDAGTTTTCPSGHPFVPGTLPTAALDAFICGESTLPAADIVMANVVNESPYAVAVAALDKQGNPGKLSEVVCDTPRATTSFYDNYKAAGGEAGGGYCSVGDRAASGVAGIATIALVVGAFVLRRRRAAIRSLTLPAAGAFVCWSTPGVAKEKPPVVAIEARVGPYRPNVDRGFVGGTPYKTTFGDSKRWMAGAELDYQAFHIPHVGSIGFGGLFGYTSASAKAEFADGKGTSDETTSLDLWLLSLVTTVRFDVLARETVVPIVPYAKAGLAWGLWNTSDGSGVVARGRTNGFLFAAGAMLLLDSLDPEAAKVFTVEHGVKHSYLFGELTVADLRGYGQARAMWVGDVTWTAGIAVEL